MKRRFFLPGLAGFALAACAADPPPKLPDPPPASATSVTHVAAPAAPRACLPKKTKTAPLLHSELAGTHAVLCYGDTDDSSADAPCAEVDVTTGVIGGTRTWPHDSAAPPPKAPASGTFVTTTTKDTISVCPAGAKAATACATIKVQHKAIAAGHGDAEDQANLIATTNTEGTRAFVYAPELKAGADRSLTTSWTVYGDTYDVKTGKRLFHQKLTRQLGQATVFTDPTNEWSAYYVGANLVLGDYVCCGPGGTTFLFDPEKGNLRTLHEYAGSLTRVEGSTFAVVDGKRLSFVDVDTMQDLGAPILAPGNRLDDPEDDSADASVFGGKVLFAFANPPGYIVADGRTHTATAPVKLALCP